ncbi:hypothetical protein KP77_11800 [Jeotgalibacillus alimentarius]|uniref:DUF3139 domain-containing protein n=1 Tax=Jeotgalibacillus alimentarius TaxID=135826 RepID=A0A0C2W6L0_9BACL|nr:hypothetical protein [Jeotgalibacillus alimentarius]KIL51668.1 hypothetical protein KP77_11800 [Jeotgalibacillus alimentarius]
MKKAFMILLILAVLTAAGFGSVKVVQASVEKSVIEYLINEKNIPEDQIVFSESFIANLPGDKNWMVSIRLKDDAKTYYYYRSSGKIVLESYTESGVEYVQ